MNPSLNLTDELIGQIAPGGALRVSINTANPLLSRKDDGGVIRGITVDIAEKFASSLGVELQIHCFDTAVKAVDAIAEGSCDMGFFAIDAARKNLIAFTPPYLLIESAYVVRKGSRILGMDQVDRPDVRVLVNGETAYGQYLGRTLKNAQLTRMTNPQGVVAQLLAGDFDVAAGVRQSLEAELRSQPDAMLLPGNFLVLQQAIGINAARGAAAIGVLGQLLEELKAQGFIDDAVRRHQLRGTKVAPAQASMN